MKKMSRTKKGAASIYIVIFTTTLLGVIALSFVRIMLAESIRTTNYSLSQSAYNSALAGIEDAKIVLLRNQNCINFGSYSSGTKKYNNDCDNYKNAFWSEGNAMKTAQDCDVVKRFLYGDKDDGEKILQTSKNTETDVIDQAYTCVKIATYTDDFLAVLGEHSSTKIIPIRTEADMQSAINRIQIQWFDDGNLGSVSKDNNLNTDIYSELGTGNLSSINPGYGNGENYGNSFGDKAIVPPPMQLTFIQTGESFSINNFYASTGIGDNSSTNRGTLFLRPTSNESRKPASGFSNTLPQNSLAYSANKSFNTPIDVYCNITDIGSEDWGNYACSADFYVPAPIEGERGMDTSYLIVSLPYAKPETDIAVKMYKCENGIDPIGAENNPCTILKFAGVQPMVDSTGRANDLFRRVESRIELADTSFPISNYALADTNENGPGVQKDFYVTTNPCIYTSSKPNGAGEVVGSDGKNINYISNGFLPFHVNPGATTCSTAGGMNGQ